MNFKMTLRKFAAIALVAAIFKRKIVNYLKPGFELLIHGWGDTVPVGQDFAKPVALPVFRMDLF